MMDMEKAIKAHSDSYLSWDVMFIGGFSILSCLAVLFAFPKSASVYTASNLAFGLAFAFNHPHFLSSYVLIYGDFRNKILKHPRYIWSAIVVPLVLGSLLAFSFATARVEWIGHTLNAMFFLVGWHYVKQVFGCVIVTSSRRRIFYQPLERRIILANLFALWALSFVQGQIGSQSFQFYGIVYSGLGLTRDLLPVAYAAVAITLALAIGMHVRKYQREGLKPSPPGVAALGALYVWYLPVFAHPMFAYFIPMFHSMQYLAFVWSFKKNQVAAEAQTAPEAARKGIWLRDFAGFAALALMLGAMSFEFVPKFLDAQKILHNPALGSSPFVAAFLMFINIHHYFIDNTIWRANNEQVKKYLFAAAPVSQVETKSPARAA